MLCYFWCFHMIQMSNNTLLDILDKSMEDVNMFLPISNVINDEITDVITNDSTLITISPEQYVREINKNYYNVENTYVVNPLKDTLEYLYGDRNIYLQNDYKGRLRDFYQQAYENDVDKQNIAKLVFTPTDYTYPYTPRTDTSPAYIFSIVPSSLRTISSPVRSIPIAWA